MECGGIYRSTQRHFPARSSTSVAEETTTDGEGLHLHLSPTKLTGSIDHALVGRLININRRLVHTWLLSSIHIPLRKRPIFQ